jgi:hypothetical protein
VTATNKKRSRRKGDGGASAIISDSFMSNIHEAAPFDSAETPQQNAARLANAAIEELAVRTNWSKPPASPLVLTSRGRAWSDVMLKPADRLPFMDVDGMTHLRINQFCEQCTNSKLCSEHEGIASTENVDLIPTHMHAMKAAGYCMVECGGGGDCFYHSMLFLARMYDQQLYDAWHDHDKFRKNTCDNLLVIIVYCIILSILTMYPDCRQFAFSGIIAWGRDDGICGVHPRQKGEPKQRETCA